MAALRVCLTGGCPALTSSTRCTTHTRERDKARGTTQQRGYDAAHVRLRAAWQRRIDSGEHVVCARCGQPIAPGDAFHLDHAKDRTRYLGPSHPACNLSAAGKARHQ